jgi:DNA-directed RNA polymerase specialized sigma24 family protein
MTLLEAFRCCGPCSGGADDSVRTEAAALLYDELRLLRIGGGNDPDRDDDVHVVMVRLLKAGPRGVRADDPDSDERVRSYLKRAVRNAGRDRARSARRFTDDDVESLPREVPAKEPFEPEAISRARTVLFEVCIPRCAAGLRKDARANFERAIAERKEMSEHGVSFVSIVERQGVNDQRGRNMVYKQHSRALTRLGNYVERYIADEGLAHTDAEALRIVCTEFCRGDLA